MKKATKKVASKPQFTALAIVLGKKYNAKGATVSEAISNLKVDNCRGKLILSVSNGETTRERVIMPMQAIRLFSLSRLSREIALKQTSQLFF